MKQKDNFIPKTKRIPKTIKASNAETEAVPKDLEDAWGAVVAIATCHKLLQEGHFTYAHRNAVGVSIAFLENLHTQALKEASEHPKSHLIPEIKTLAEKKAQYGKENQ